MKINYFDFLKIFPQIIVIKDLPVDKLSYINFIQKLHEDTDKKPLIMLNMDKLENLILKAKKTNIKKYDILRENLFITINDDQLFVIKHTENLNHFEKNNKNETDGDFNILINSHNGYYYFNEQEMKNVKRSLLIDKCLNGKSD